MSSEVETSLIILRQLRFNQGRWVFGSCALSKITLSGVWQCFYVPGVIDRYSRPQMRAIWSDECKFQIWLEIETIACEAMARLGLIPKEDAAVIRKKGKFEIDEIAEIEKRTNHDVIAFLENVASYVGPAARWIHQGLTSSDILDTTLAAQMTESAQILADDLAALRKIIGKQARRYKKTPMIGRSHGIHAEPITFGLKLALMFDEFGRAEERLAQTRERIRVGKLSGAVGTHAHVDPKVERAVCEKLGLKPATLSTQIVQRDRHAEFCATLALIASSIDRWATEFRHLQRTEVLELEEFFGEGQKGSSAMPHKRNPITSERLSGLARVIRGNAIVALTKGLYFSQSILLALTRAGVERKTAYEAVQRAAMKTWKGEGTFVENAKREPDRSEERRVG